MTDIQKLIEEARTWAALIGTEPRGARALFDRLADTLEQVTAERDRLRKAIEEALSKLCWFPSNGADKVLSAALTEIGEFE